MSAEGARLIDGQRVTIEPNTIWIELERPISNGTVSGQNNRHRG